MTKRCSKSDCRKIKSLDNFYYNMKAKDHKDSWCKECKKSYVAKFQKDHKDKTQANKNAWQKRNNDTIKSLTAKRRASKLNATPVWLTKAQLKEIKIFYKNCPKGYEVDHIIPLQGREVKGLHVSWNLQYLTISENRSKSNKFTNKN
jgi:hypothetical protein